MQQANVDMNLGTKQARRRGFLAQLDRVVPWADVEALIEPHALKSKSGHPPFALQTVPHIHLMPQWFTLSDPAMQDALHNLPLFREFAPLTRERRLPDESPIARFRRLMDRHTLAERMLALINQVPQGNGLMRKAGTVVDATPIAAPGLTKKASVERHLKMRQSKKGDQRFLARERRVDGKPLRLGLVGPSVMDRGRLREYAALVTDVKHAKFAHPPPCLPSQFFSNDEL